MKMLCLGDSYTIGEGVDVAKNWPNTLVTKLAKQGILVECCDIVAKTGWTTNELDHEINMLNLSSDYDLVSLLIGVNNQYRGQDIGVFRAEFSNLLNRAIRFAKNNPARVIVISIPGYDQTMFAKMQDKLIERKAKYPEIKDVSAAEIGQTINDYNHVIKDIITNLNVKNKNQIAYVDITTISRARANLTIDDGLHYNPEMYDIWANIILPYALEILRL